MIKYIATMRVLVFATVLITKFDSIASAATQRPQDGHDQYSVDESGQSRGLIARTDCDEADGGCQHVEHGDIVQDRYYTKGDDFHRVSRTNTGNNISISLTQEETDNDEQLDAIESRITDEMQDQVLVHHVASWGIALGVGIAVALCFGARRLYTHRLSKKAKARKLADLQLQVLRGIFDANPVHCVDLLRELLSEHSKEWCKQQLAERSAVEARKELSKNEARRLIDQNQMDHYSFVRQGRPTSIVYDHTVH